MVMKRKSELRIKREAQEAYCKVYLCFIDCQQFDSFSLLMYLNLSFAAVLHLSSPFPVFFSKSILLFHFYVSKRKSDFEYCSENMLEEFLILFLVVYFMCILGASKTSNWNCESLNRVMKL